MTRFLNAAGKMVDWPEVKAILDETPATDDGTHCLTATMWQCDDPADIPPMCQVRVSKMTCSSLMGEHIFLLTDGDGKQWGFDHGREVGAALSGDSMMTLRLVGELLESVDLRVIEQFIIDTFQITRVVISPSLTVDNGVYGYDVEAELAFPECYADLGWQDPKPIMGHTTLLRSAWIWLAEKLSGFPSFRRTADAFQIEPYCIGHRPGDPPRCRRCGRVLTDDLRFPDGTGFICPNESCPHHTKPQC